MDTFRSSTHMAITSPPRTLEFAGLKMAPRGHVADYAVYDRFHVIYVQQGWLLLEVGGQSERVTPGMAAVLRMGTPHRYSCPETAYAGVHYASVSEEPWFRGVSMAVQGTPATEMIADRLRRESEAPGLGGTEVVLSLGRTLAWLVLREVEIKELGRKDAGENPGVRTAQRARMLLEAAVYKAVSTEAALAPMRMSYRQTSRHFAAEFGLPPKTYLTRRKMEEALRFLGRTDIRVTDIAMELGFASSQHFATAFRKATGSSPGAWRSRQLPTGNRL